MHRASGEELSSNFARLATPAVNSSLFFADLQVSPRKTKSKAAPPKNPETAKTPNEMDEHYVGPQPTGTQTRNQTKPTDRPTEPSTGPGPGADTKLHHEILTCA